MTGVDQRVVVEPDDGSLGPLLRVADDHLAPGGRYGTHEHRAVDVVAVVLAGSLTHDWDPAAELTAGDVAVLRAGLGLAHDEWAGGSGARVLQCYLRAADPAARPSHEVVRGADGWVDLGRPDARLWVGRGGASVPTGLVLTIGDGGVIVGGRTGGPGQVIVVWDLDVRRPHWAT